MFVRLTTNRFLCQYNKIKHFKQLRYVPHRYRTYICTVRSFVPALIICSEVHISWLLLLQIIQLSPVQCLVSKITVGIYTYTIMNDQYVPCICLKCQRNLSGSCSTWVLSASCITCCTQSRQTCLYPQLKIS